MNSKNSKNSPNKIILLFAISMMLNGCMLLPREATIPIKSIANIQQNSTHETLIIFLPGYGDNETHFIDNGFFESIRATNLPVDLISVDAHFGYYKQRNLVERLNKDIIQPALTRGYNKIWLVGTSMGGLGVMLYAQEYSEHIKGLITIAPYMGDRSLIEEIDTAGGIALWKPNTDTDLDYQRKLWVWLQSYAGESETRPKFHMLYGKQDKLAHPNALFAATLPTENVITMQGGHKWTIWKQLWDRLLETPPF